MYVSLFVCCLRFYLCRLFLAFLSRLTNAKNNENNKKKIITFLFKNKLAIFQLEILFGSFENRLIKIKKNNSGITIFENESTTNSRLTTTNTGALAIRTIASRLITTHFFFLQSFLEWYSFWIENLFAFCVVVIFHFKYAYYFLFLFLFSTIRKKIHQLWKLRPIYRWKKNFFFNFLLFSFFFAFLI